MVVTSSDFCVAIIIIATSTTLQVVELVSIQVLEQMVVTSSSCAAVSGLMSTLSGRP
jgi:hypothetical protein